MVDGSTIAAILTGVLALAGAVATAWLSGWNEQRSQERKNRKVLAKYAVPLLIAAWDLANWFGDILNDDYYDTLACSAYGDGWNSQFTSYLIGQYLASIYILREKTFFLSHISGPRVHKLKKLLWKIQNEFTSMHYTERESREMRWYEGDMLAVQEHMTIVCDLDGDGNAGELRTMRFVEFQQNYKVEEHESNDSKSKDSKSNDSESKDPEPNNSKSLELKKIFGAYEIHFQRIVYRRFKYLYATKFKGRYNPQEFQVQDDTLVTAEINQDSLEEELLFHKELEEMMIQTELRENPVAGLIVPDWRVRRIQHLLCDLVELLDDVSGMKFNRPIKKCVMLVPQNVAPGTIRVPCDCSLTDCNAGEQDFTHRQLTGSGKTKEYPKKDKISNSTHREPTWQDRLRVESKEKEQKGSDSQQFSA